MPVWSWLRFQATGLFSPSTSCLNRGRLENPPPHKPPFASKRESWSASSPPRLLQVVGVHIALHPRLSRFFRATRRSRSVFCNDAWSFLCVFLFLLVSMFAFANCPFLNHGASGVYLLARGKSPERDGTRHSASPTQHHSEVWKCGFWFHD